MIYLFLTWLFSPLLYLRLALRCGTLNPNVSYIFGLPWAASPCRPANQS